MKKTIEALARAYQEVKEGRFIIPEEVPANERTAFHGAAAAAHKDGKSHFMFGGKKYPVTMKKDTATAIADDAAVTVKGKYRAANNPFRGGRPTVKTEDVENEMMHNDKVVLKSKKKKKGEDDPQGENGETATMNPKNENVRSADKKPEIYTGSDGKKHVRMVPVDREVIKKESTDMSIREKLLSVLENRGEHVKGATKPEGLHDKSQSSKGAMDMLNTPKEVGADIKKATDDNAKAEKKAKVSPKNSTDKNAPGDTKVINPPEDITKKAGMKESFSKTIRSLASAYQSMYDKKPVEEAVSKAATDAAQKISDKGLDDHNDAFDHHSAHIDFHMRKQDQHKNARGYTTDEHHNDDPSEATLHQRHHTGFRRNRESENLHRKALSALETHGVNSTHYQNAAAAANRSTQHATKATTHALNHSGHRNGFDLHSFHDAPHKSTDEQTYDSHASQGRYPKEPQRDGYTGTKKNS